MAHFSSTSWSLNAVVAVAAAVLGAGGVMGQPAASAPMPEPAARPLSPEYGHLLLAKPQRVAPASAAIVKVPPLLHQIADVMGAGIQGDSASAAGGVAQYLLGARTDLPKTETGLAPIMATLPRGLSGRLPGPSVRYALHSYFVREFGWRLKGLDPAGGLWNDTSPADVLALQRMPDAVRDLIRQRLEGTGMDEKDLAVLAYTLKYLIHDETAARLRSVYDLLEIPIGVPAWPRSAEFALQVHLESQIVNQDLSTVSLQQTEAMHEEMPLVYPSWNETVNFIHRTLKEQRTTKGAVPFEDSLRVLRNITERYGLWQDRECRTIKSMLLKFEDRGSGRVQLSDFYRASVGGAWQFRESVDYLRQLGALDETMPANPRVIVPNYVLSAANCVGSTGYNDFCCVSECEGLMAQIERSVGAPDADPSALADVVAALGSSTLPEGLRMDAMLTRRLRSIAAQHDGRVPIHGRLFSQWMHHAYPRECPFPHAAGTTKQVSIFEALAAGSPREASVPEMSAFASRPTRKNAPAATLPWDPREELVAPSLRDATHPTDILMLHSFFTCAAVCALAISLFRTARRARRLRSSRKEWAQFPV